MKAKIKATGKEIVVEPYGDEYAQILPDGGFKVYTKQELVFPNEIDWQQVRIQAAIAAMNGYQSAPIIPGCDPNPTQQEIAKWSVQLADALVAELKHSEDVYAECRRLAAINTASVCENMTNIQKELQKKGGQHE